MTIIVVNDELPLCEHIAIILEDAGYTVASHLDGRQALEYLQQTKHVPCLILLDVYMPFMDGWRFRQQQVRDPRLASIPVVILSPVDADRTTAQSLGCDFLRLPFGVSELEQLATRYCGPPP